MLDTSLVFTKECTFTAQDRINIHNISTTKSPPYIPSITDRKAYSPTPYSCPISRITTWSIHNNPPSAIVCAKQTVMPAGYTNFPTENTSNPATNNDYKYEHVILYHP